MPWTVNGIGTSYVGKKDRVRITATCQFCGSTTQLDSYQTRECVVVLFIPLLPLRRFQILNDCTVCRRHQRVPAKKFEELREQDIEAAKKAVAAEPHNVEALERLCGVLLAYQQPGEAKKAYEMLLQECPERASVHYGYATTLHGLAQTEHAAQEYRRTLELDPTIDGGRAVTDYSDMLVGMKRNDESLAVLKEYAQANWGSTGFVATLGDRAYALKDYATAANAYAHLLEMLPAMRNDKKFMKALTTAHKKAGLELSVG